MVIIKLKLLREFQHSLHIILVKNKIAAINNFAFPALQHIPGVLQRCNMDLVKLILVSSNMYNRAPEKFIIPRYKGEKLYTTMREFDIEV